jgi:hypothetical protein
MSDFNASLARLDELLLRRATEGLDAAAAAELRALLAAHPDADEDRYERAAAAVLLASLGEIEPMPASVKQNLARRWQSGGRR